ncbi:MAG TPA: FtsW/RodA/SpoVE family cell cycle protein, partial [Opitutales bacterium]|nr:FtsW/RodA/SpoVE family cell cycle protein [Opitutales bacterium]
MALPVSINPEFGIRGRISRALPAMLLVMCCGCLLIMGLLVLYSAGLGESGAPQTFIRKQALFACVGALTMVFAWRIDLEWPRRFVIPIALVCIALLASVLVPGVARSINGSRRWLDLGPVNMQVSDFAKIGLVFVLAHYLALEQRRMDSFWRGYAIPLAIVGYRMIGYKFILRTIVAVCFQSLLLTFLPAPTVPLISDRLLNCAIGGAVSGYGVGLALREGGSGGGTD